MLIQLYIGSFIVRYSRIYKRQNMYILCNSCGKEFNDLVEGVRYSSSTKGVLFFCSDDCCKNYLNRAGK
jgi:hypothetical protein